jgi:hypothetical protein
MGNAEAGEMEVPRDFPINKYMNQGLNQKQILGIKRLFDNCEPEDGLIDVKKFRPASGDSQSQLKIDKLLGKKEKMNFDEFLALSREIFKEESSNKQLNIDNNEIEASCLFCPYAIDRKH